MGTTAGSRPPIATTMIALSPCRTNTTRRTSSASTITSGRCTYKRSRRFTVQASPKGFLRAFFRFMEGTGEMDVPGPERRLAAVLAADMVGYSRLMEVDETGTLARLKTHRIELIDPAIAKNRGRIIKTTGDGMLVEFHSVADAVLCAAEIQRRMARRNSDVSPARWMQFRIGINLGDVIVEENEIFGDGVNVAARL